MARRSLHIEYPLHLGATLGVLRHGSRDPTVRIAAGEAWRATRTPHGPASIHVRIEADSGQAEAWGPGAEWVLDGLPALLGSEDDVTTFRPEGVVGRLHRRRPGLRFCRTQAVFEAMLPHIIGQKVTGKGATESYRRLVWQLGEPAPGPHGLRLQPAPERLAGLAYEEFHPFNIERRRADAIRVAAGRAARLEEALDMDVAASWERLTALPGIGVWTAAAVRQVACGDGDAVMVGDYHIPSLVTWVLAGEPRGDDDRMLELLEPYRGHRGRVVRLLKGANAPPRFGPRLPVRDIATS